MRFMQLLHDINNLIENKNYTEALEELNKINKEELIKFNKKLIKSYNSLKLKCYIYKNLIDNALEFFKTTDNLMKRDYLLFITKFYKLNKDICILIFNTYIKNSFKLLEKDIDDLIENECFDIIKLLDGYFYKSSKESIFNSYDKLKFIKLPDKITTNCITIFKNLINNKNYDELLEKLNNKDLIIDGGNILHHKNGEPNYDYLLEFLNKIKDQNFLFIIHKSHFKNSIIKNNISANKIYTLFKNKIFLAPYNIYDDYYILISLFLKQIPVVTNDNFNDHIFILKNLDDKHFGRIKETIKDLILNYKNFKVNDFKNYSNCIQVFDNDIFIPCLI